MRFTGHIVPCLPKILRNLDWETRTKCKELQFIYQNFILPTQNIQ